MNCSQFEFSMLTRTKIRVEQAIMSGDGQQQYEALARMARDNEKARQQFVELGVLNEGTNAFRYSIDALDRMASAFNVNFRDGATETDKNEVNFDQITGQKCSFYFGRSW